MKLAVRLSIGYVGADRESVLEIDDSDLEGLTPKERDDYLLEAAKDWSDDYINLYYEELK